MAEPDQDAERLLAAYRQVRSPSDADTRTAWAGMRARLERDDAPLIDLGSRRRSLATKVAIAALALAAILALAFALDLHGAIARRLAAGDRAEATYQGGVPERGETPRATAERAGGDGEGPAEQPRARTPSADATTDLAMPDATVSLEPAPATPEAESPAKAPSHKPRAKRAGGNEVPDDASLHAEMALLSAAQSALAAGNPERALTSLERHARRFPDSLLAEEREVARIRALCALGRDAEVATARRRFDARFRGSPLRGRAMAECEPKGDDGP
jgi:hypothetical protein